MLSFLGEHLRNFFKKTDFFWVYRMKFIFIRYNPYHMKIIFVHFGECREYLCKNSRISVGVIGI